MNLTPTRTLDRLVHCAARVGAVVALTLGSLALTLPMAAASRGRGTDA